MFKMANSDSLSSMDTGRVVKMEVDYSSTCDQRIPECEALAASGKIHESLENLLALEKQTRTVRKHCTSSCKTCR